MHHGSCTAMHGTDSRLAWAALHLGVTTSMCGRMERPRVKLSVREDHRDVYCLPRTAHFTFTKSHLRFGTASVFAWPRCLRARAGGIQGSCSPFLNGAG